MKKLIFVTLLVAIGVSCNKNTPSEKTEVKTQNKKVEELKVKTKVKKETVKKVEKTVVKPKNELKEVKKVKELKLDRENPKVDCEEIVKLSYKYTGKVEGLRYMTKDCIGNTEYSQSINEDLGTLMRKQAPATIQFLEKELLQVLGNKSQVNFIIKRMKEMLIDELAHFEELEKSFSQAKDSPLKKRIEKEVLPIFRKLYKESVKVATISKIDSKVKKDSLSFTGVFVSAYLGFEASGYYITLKNNTGKKTFKSKESPEIAFFVMTKETGVPVTNKELLGQKFTIYHKPGTEEDPRGETVKVNLYLQGEVAESTRVKTSK